MATAVSLEDDAEVTEDAAAAEPQHREGLVRVKRKRRHSEPSGSGNIVAVEAVGDGTRGCGAARGATVPPDVAKAVGMSAKRMAAPPPPPVAEAGRSSSSSKITAKAVPALKHDTKGKAAVDKPMRTKSRTRGGGVDRIRGGGDTRGGGVTSEGRATRGGGVGRTRGGGDTRGDGARRSHRHKRRSRHSPKQPKHPPPPWKVAAAKPDARGTRGCGEKAARQKLQPVPRGSILKSEASSSYEYVEESEEEEEPVSEPCSVEEVPLATGGPKLRRRADTPFVPRGRPQQRSPARRELRSPTRTKLRSPVRPPKRQRLQQVRRTAPAEAAGGNPRMRRSESADAESSESRGYSPSQSMYLPPSMQDWSPRPRRRSRSRPASPPPSDSPLRLQPALVNKYGADLSLFELNMLIGMEPWTLHHGADARMCTVFIGMTDLVAKHVAAMDGYPEAVVIDLKSTDVEQTTVEAPWPFIMAASRFWEQVSVWQSKTWTCRESTCIEGFWLLKLQPIRQIAHIDKLVLGILVAGPALDVKKHGEWMASTIRGYKAILLVVLGTPHDSSGGLAAEQEASTEVYHPMVRKIFESECFQDWAVRCHEVVIRGCGAALIRGCGAATPSTSTTTIIRGCGAANGSLQAKSRRHGTIIAH